MIGSKLTLYPRATWILLTFRMASCGVNEESEQMKRRGKVRSKTCIKCKSTRGNVLIRDLAYCRVCLEALVLQRFKRAIDENIPANNASASILALGYSGGLGSTLLLDLVAQSLSVSAKRTRRHRWDAIHVIYVDTANASTYSGLSPTTEDIQRVVSTYPGLHLTVIPLENAFLNTGSSCSCRLWKLSYGC